MLRDPISFRAGQSLGRYELLAPIAKGGMGQVWVGRLRGARGFQKLVAIKTLLPASEDSARMERMLFEEARIASSIQHSNVVHTIELGEHQGALYLVMEWVDGEPLSQLLKVSGSRGLPLLLAVNLIGQTLRGMQAAHELCDEAGAPLGVVHRDISPHNILVSYRGVAKLVDFGIAKAMNQDSSSTTTGEIKGKFAYMAPEQILGGEVDQRADLFSLGIILYSLTCGAHPFKNHDSAGVLHSITSDEPATRPSLLKPGYSRTLEAVVMKALAKDREHRWSNAAEMRAALQRALPDAFAVGVEAQLETYLTEVVGDRAREKRDFLRRAALSRGNSSADPASLDSASAQSASSLRAVSVDTDGGGGAKDASIAHPSRSPTARPSSALAFSPPRSRHGALMGGLAAGLLLVSLVLHTVRRTPEVTRHAAAAPIAAFPTSERHAINAPSAAATPEAALPAPTSSVSSALPPTAPTSLHPAKKGRWRAPAVAPSADLIPPDYAR